MVDFRLTGTSYLTPDASVTPLEVGGVLDYDEDYSRTFLSIPENYFGMGFRLSVEFENFPVSLPDVFAKSGPLVAIDYSYLSGNERTNGSYRHQGTLLFGWRQRFFEHFFVQPSGGVGYTKNSINFDRGIPTPVEKTFNAHAEGVGGVEYCFTPSFCPSLMGGYYYDRAISGPISYSSSGPMAGLQLSGNIL